MIGEKDKNQREECGCFESVEVGAYNTCLNGCKYCYANFNDEKVKENVRLYNQASPLLCGNITSDDKITDRKVKTLKDAQLSFLNNLHLDERREWFHGGNFLPQPKVNYVLSLCSIKSKFRGILKPSVCFRGKLDFLRFVGY